MTLRPKIDVTVLASLIAATSICSCASTAHPAKAPAKKPPLIALAEHLPAMPPPTPEKPLLVVYPRGAEIAASSSFVCGATLPGFTVTVNGQNVSVNKEGFFAYVVPLKPDKNIFVVQATSPTGAVTATTVTATREKAPPLMSADNLAFDQQSLKPSADLGRTAGDIIEFSCRATPGAKVSVNFGARSIPLVCLNNLTYHKSQGGKSKLDLAASGINPGLFAAYGQVFQRYPAHRADFYVGLYKLQPDDQFADAAVNFKLQKDGKETTALTAARITLIKQPIIAHCLADDTIVRTAPDAGRLTPLPAGVRLMVDGYDGENIRCLYRAGKHVWIKKAALTMEENGAPAPAAVARTIIVKKDKSGESVVIPLSQRLPFTIEQSLNPNKLILKLYGVSSDTDWVYQAPVEDDNGNLVENVTWKQPDDGTYEVTIDLKNNRQWGFYADYGQNGSESETVVEPEAQNKNDNNLVLHIKNPPDLIAAKNAQNKIASLQGLSICIDPGHGGAELGAIGLSGIREAQINLAIAQKVKEELLKAGATVYMTRDDDSDVSLDDRVAFAKKKAVDLLISVHNNALPDGRDPNKEHGTSTYYYHPQSKELATILRDAMTSELKLKPLGARYQNLALCRPSNMQAVLVEVGFMVNPDEYALLIDPAFQKRAAVALKDGLITYFAK